MYIHIYTLFCTKRRSLHRELIYKIEEIIPTERPFQSYQTDRQKSDSNTDQKTDMENLRFKDTFSSDPISC